MPKKRRPKIQRRQATTSSIKGHQGAKPYLGVKATRLPRSWAAKEAHRSTLFKVASQLNVPVFDYPSRSPRVYKNSKELQKRIASGLISPLRNSLSKSDSSTSPREFPPATSREYDPLRIPPHHPHTSRQPPWRDPLGPFAVGGEDLDPFRGQRGGMILDPLRTGFPRALIDPSSGLPNRLPPGAVPPGARFDPFGPIGTSPSGPSPDHLPPPGYDDMFM